MLGPGPVPCSTVRDGLIAPLLLRSAPAKRRRWSARRFMSAVPHINPHVDGIVPGPPSSYCRHKPPAHAWAANTPCMVETTTTGPKFGNWQLLRRLLEFQSCLLRAESTAKHQSPVSTSIASTSGPRFIPRKPQSITTIFPLPRESIKEL